MNIVKIASNAVKGLSSDEGFDLIRIRCLLEDSHHAHYAIRLTRRYVGDFIGECSSYSFLGGSVNV